MTGTAAADRDLATAIAAEVPALLRTARALTRDPHAAEDLVQDTVTRALEKGGTFRGDSSLRHWLRRIMHHLAVDRWRRDREISVAEVEESWMDDDYTVDAVAVVERAETRAEIEDALVRLPYDYRTAVVLHDLEGITVREVAEITDVALPAAKQRLRRGRMMLVTALAEGYERRVALDGVPLRCWDARRQVSDYLDGDVDAPTAALLERHLETCPTCPPLVAALVGVRDRVRGMRDPDSVVDPATAARLRQRLRAD